MVIAMTLLTIFGKMLIPVINNARDSGNENSFKRYHLLSVMMNVVTLILGIVVLGMHI